MLDRRQLVGGVVGLAVLGSRSWRASAAPARPGPARVSLAGELSRAVFLALLGETFTASSGPPLRDAGGRSPRAGRAGRVAIQLIQIDEPHPSEVTEQFSLVFRGPLDRALPEGLYAVRHRTAGRTDLYLQPGGHDDSFSYCEAPFNLLR
jgi:hypothetical protein